MTVDGPGLSFLYLNDEEIYKNLRDSKRYRSKNRYNRYGERTGMTIEEFKKLRRRKNET